MKKMIIGLVAAAFVLSACGKQDGPRKLSSEEMARATANGKQYFMQEHVGMVNGVQWKIRGTITSVSPTDSNSNGFVSVFGKVPDATGMSFVDKQIFCGYDGTVDGCQPADLMPGK